MGWTRKALRATLRHRRPDIEALESRELLTASLAHAGKHLGHPVDVALTSRPSPVDTSLSSKSSSASDLIGAAQARDTYGVDGSGMTVALIDTGIDYHDTGLGNGYGPGHKVVAGYDFIQNDGDPYASTPHGTAVASLVASSDPGHPGVAPGADLAALRVFGNDSQGSFENVARALQWVIDNHDKDHITAVNLSLADPNNYAQNWFAQDRGVGQKITGLIAQLDALNIPVVAATGNSFKGQQGAGFPAIIPDTISVTSTDATGSQLTGDAQRLGPDIGGASATDIAAPGEGVVAPISGNQIGTMDGTSFAAPQVTGAVVLLQQIYESRFGRLPTVAQLDSWLEQGSSPVNDPVTKLSIGRLNISRAASLIPNPQLQVLTPPQPDSNWTTGSVSTSSTGLANDASSNIVAADQQQHQQPSDSSSQASTGTNDTSGQKPGSSRVGNLVSVISGAVKSLSGWAHGPDGGAPEAKARIWTQSGTQKDLGNTQPTGQIKSVVRVTNQGSLDWGPTGSSRRPAFVRGVRPR
jgi:subtilisin family serine protease